MLTLEPPYFSVKGIIIFRDHASPSTFYYLAGPPELSKRADGKPDFMLLKYREALDASGNVTVAQKEQLGGAFLIFGVDCALSPNVLAEIQGEISAYAPSGDIQLVPVLYTSGSVKVVALDYQPTAGTATRFVRGVIGTATPSLLQDQRAIFSVSLDPDAATLLEAAYDDDLSPIGVMYELQFTGLRPALSVRATIDYKRAYEYFKTHLSVGIHTGSTKTTTDDTNNKTGGATPPATPPPATPPPATPPAANPPAANPPAANPPAANPPAANPPAAAAIPQPIVVTITTPGAIGTMKFTTKVGLQGTASAPATSRPGAIPVGGGTNTSLTFTGGTYVAGSGTFTFTTATASGPIAWAAGIKNPAVNQNTTAPAAAGAGAGGPGAGAGAGGPGAGAGAGGPGAGAGAGGPGAGAGAGGPGGGAGGPGGGAGGPGGGAGGPGGGAGGAGGAGSTTPTPITTNQVVNADQTQSQFGLDVDIQYAMEKLQQEEAIKIEIVREMDGTSIDAMQTQAMALLKDNLLTEFFKPALASMPATPAVTAPTTPVSNTAPTAATINRPATAPAGAGDSTNTSNTSSGASSSNVAIGFQLNYLTQDELRTATYDYSVAAPETRLHAPSGFFSLLLKGTKREELIKDISLDDPFFQIVNAQISTIAEWAALDLKSIVVNAWYGGTDGEKETKQTYSLSPADDAPKSFEAYIEKLDMSWRSNIQYTFGTAQSIGLQPTQYQTPWVRSTSRALVVAPQNDVPMVRVFVEPGVVDWDLVAKVETLLTYDDPGTKLHVEEAFMVASDSPRTAWLVRLSTPGLDTYTVRYTWHLKDGRVLTGKPFESRAPQLFVSDPFVDRIPITIQALVDPSSVARVTVAVTYTDKQNNLTVRKSVDLLGPAFHPVCVTIPISDVKKRTYSYSATIIGTNGNQENRPETDSTELSLDISDGSTILDAQVMLLGDLVAANVSGIQVDLQAAPPDGQQPTVQSHLFDGTDRKWTQRLLLRSDRPSRTYQYRTTVFADGRAPTPTDWIDCDTPILTLLVSRLVSS